MSTSLRRPLNKSRMVSANLMFFLSKFMNYSLLFLIIHLLLRFVKCFGGFLACDNSKSILLLSYVLRLFFFNNSTYTSCRVTQFESKILLSIYVQRLYNIDNCYCIICNNISTILLYWYVSRLYFINKSTCIVFACSNCFI